MAKIEYINISEKEYLKLSDKKRKEKPYCIEYNDGTKDWIVNDKLHREEGPAVVYYNKKISWYLNGTFYFFEEWCNELNKTDEEKVFLRLKYL